MQYYMVYDSDTLGVPEHEISIAAGNDAAFARMEGDVCLLRYR
jgi:hypothetical protein